MNAVEPVGMMTPPSESWRGTDGRTVSLSTFQTMTPPDLTRYRLSTNSTDELEDTIAWASSQAELAPDGRVGIVGFSFSGGLALVAAGRPAVRDRVAFVLSFGGHGDLSRVLRYLCQGTTDIVDASARGRGPLCWRLPRP